MKRIILAVVAAILVSTVSYSAPLLVPVVASCGTPPQTYNPGNNYQITQDTTGKLCIAGSFSASVTTAGFRQTSIGTPITASTGGATGSLPSNGGTVLAENNSTTIPAYCALGASGSASAVLIAPLSSVAFTISGDTQMTCYTASSTASVLLQGGSGLATGWGGGGGAGGGGASFADEGSFTAGSSNMGPIGGFYQTTATSNALTNGQGGWAQMTAQRALFANLRNASGTEIATASNPAQVSLANTGSNSTALNVALPTSPALASGSGVILSTSAGAAVDATHGTYANLLQGNAVISATNGIYDNILQGNAVISATNGLYSNLLQGNAVVSASNPVPANLAIGGAVVSATNGEYANLLQGNAVISATNGLYTNLLQANAVIGTSNPLSTAIVASGGAITATGTNLNVQCANCSGSGVSAADGASWTVNSSLLAPSGGVYQTTVTSNPLTAGTEGTWQLTHYRAGMVDWYNASGTEMGTSGSPVQVSLANTAANATAVKVDGSAVTQPVSGTVTANAGTNLNTSALALETGGNLASIKTDTDNLNFAQGSTTSGQHGGLFLGATTTSAPTYTTAQSNPLSLTTAGALRTDASATTQPISGTVTANAGSGTFTVSGTVTANAGTNLNTSLLALETGGNLASIKTDTDNLALSQGSTTSGQKGNLTLGAVTTSAPSYTTAQSSPFSLTTAGALRTDASGTTQPVSGTVTANAGTNLNTSALATDAHLTGVQGTIGAGSAPANMIVGGLIYNSSAPSPTNGQSVAFQSDSAGNLKVVGQGLTQGAATSGQPGSLILGAVTSSGAGYSAGNSNPLTLDTNGYLKMDCVTGCSSSGGSSQADEAAFSFGSTSFTGTGGVYQTTATSNALTTGQAGAFQVTANRALFTNLRNASGTEIGTASTPVQVSLANTATNGTSVVVAGPGSAGTPSGGVVSVQGVSGGTAVPVSGTFWQATQPVSIASAQVASGAVASGAYASGSIASGAVASGAVASGAFASGSISDGAEVTLGAKADAKNTATDTTAITVMSVLKEISAMEQAPASRAVTNVGTFATQSEITAASGSIASGAVASGAVASGAFASGSIGSGAIAAGAIAAGASAGDPCTFGTKVNLPIATSTATLLQQVAASGSTKIYICSIAIVANAATAFNLNYGTGTNCATSPGAVIGSTTAGSGMSLAANGGFTLGNGGATVAVTPASQALCTLQSNAVAIAGVITYVQQ